MLAWFALLALPLPGFAVPIISELMPSNSSTIADQDGDYADWLEIYNPGTAPADLTGWYLTNKAGNLNKWQFPAVTIPAGGYLVVFCSQKNYTDPTKPLATSFNLSASGGFVALVEPDGATIASSYNFPAQYTDISWGVSQPTDGEVAQTGYFETPTPGTANGDHSNILLTDTVTISQPAGIFIGNLSVTLTGAAAGEHIRYVLAAPSAAGDSVAVPTAASPEYTGPITVNATALLRAAVFSADDSQRGFPATAMLVQLDASTSNRLDTFSSNLPLLLFDDNGYGLLPDDDLYHPGWLGAFSPQNGRPTTLVQQPDFFTPSGFQLHGHSSAAFPKQSYDADLEDTLGGDLDESVFGMDSDKDWASVAPWFYDRTFIHNAFVYALSREMGHWAASTQFAETFVHSAGGPLDETSYAGLTTVVDRIKVGSNRVNIFSISPNDVTAPNLTGGYILRIDWPQTNEYTWTTTSGVTLMVDTPKLDEIVQPQVQYITGYVQQMENAMNADQGSGWTTHTYLNYLDRPSWVDYHLLNVFTENPDAFTYSEYFTKDVNGLIVAGPVWDFDRSMGSADGRDADPDQWQAFGDPAWSGGWWGTLVRDPDFMQAWVDRWQGLRSSVLSNGNMTALANALAAQVGPAAAARDEARWSDDSSRFGSWMGEITNMTSWLTTRAAWLDSQFAAPPTVQSSAGGVTLTPPPGATIAYTLNGTDPRQSGGAVASGALMSASAVSIPTNQNFAARTYQASMASAFPGSPWSSPVGASNRLINVSCRAQIGTVGDILIEGFVVSGPSNSQEQVLVRGVGPTLSQYGVSSGLLQHPTIALFDGSGNVIATNTGWATSPNAGSIGTTATLVGAFPLPPSGADSALLASLSPGAYTLQVSGVSASTGIALGEIYEASSNGASIVNLSARGVVGTGTASLITGVIVSGVRPQKLLLRASGPALAAYGITDYIAQPSLAVVDSNGNTVASNTGWSTNTTPSDISSAAAAVGAFPFKKNSADSAVLVTLPAGAYTMVVTGVSGSTGVTLAESYAVP